jgi:hypothetical protein
VAFGVKVWGEKRKRDDAGHNNVQQAKEAQRSFVLHKYRDIYIAIFFSNLVPLDVKVQTKRLNLKPRLGGRLHSKRKRVSLVQEFVRAICCK